MFQRWEASQEEAEGGHSQHHKSYSLVRNKLLCAQSGICEPALMKEWRSICEWHKAGLCLICFYVFRALKRLWSWHMKLWMPFLFLCFSSYVLYGPELRHNLVKTLNHQILKWDLSEHYDVLWNLNVSVWFCTWYFFNFFNKIASFSDLLWK